MTSRCMSACFIVFIVASGLFHLVKIILNAIFAYYLWHDPKRSDWSTVVIGLLLLPSVTIQLMSAVLLLQKKGETLSFSQIAVTALLHFLQLGFIWRHVAIVTEKNDHVKKNDLFDLCLLHLVYAFLAGLPLLSVQTFIMFYYTDSDWLILSSASASLLTTCWAIAIFRQQHEKEELKHVILTWPGILFQLIWRIGEVLTRLISVAVFTVLYQYWTFLVFTLHFVTMFVCICVTGFGVSTFADKSPYKKVFVYTITAYIYCYCYINFTDKRIHLRSFAYYLIMFLENGVLVTVWLMNVYHLDNGTTYLILFIALSAYFVAMVSMIIYYKFFHIPVLNILSQKENGCLENSCINCKLGMCAKHNLKLQRPFNPGWLSKYQAALCQGQNNKVFLQDSIFDSLSEWIVETNVDSSSEEGDVMNHKVIDRPNNKKVIKSCVHSCPKEIISSEQMMEQDSDSLSSENAAGSETCSTSDSQSDYTDVNSYWGSSNIRTTETNFVQMHNEKNQTVVTKTEKGYLLENGSQYLYEIAQSPPTLKSNFYRQRIVPLPAVTKPTSSRTHSKRHNVSMTSSSAESAICGSSDVTDISNRHSKAGEDSEMVSNDLNHSSLVSTTEKRIKYEGHSESEDSAFPQENVSSVNGASVVMDDAASESSLEMII